MKGSGPRTPGDCELCRSGPTAPAWEIFSVPAAANGEHPEELLFFAARLDLPRGNLGIENRKSDDNAHDDEAPQALPPRGPRSASAHVRRSPFKSEPPFGAFSELFQFQAACQSLLNEYSAAHKIGFDSDRVTKEKREVPKTFVHASAGTDAPLSEVNCWHGGAAEANYAARPSRLPRLFT